MPRNVGGSPLTVSLSMQKVSFALSEAAGGESARYLPKGLDLRCRPIGTEVTVEHHGAQEVTQQHLRKVVEGIVDECAGTGGRIHWNKQVQLHTAVFTALFPPRSGGPPPPPMPIYPAGLGFDIEQVTGGSPFNRWGDPSKPDANTMGAARYERDFLKPVP